MTTVGQRAAQLIADLRPGYWWVRKIVNGVVINKVREVWLSDGVLYVMSSWGASPVDIYLNEEGCTFVSFIEGPSGDPTAVWSASECRAVSRELHRSESSKSRGRIKRSMLVEEVYAVGDYRGIFADEEP